ncbi:hypothetical protein ACI2OX_01530 [Bacillus sp. N9]
MQKCRRINLYFRKEDLSLHSLRRNIPIVCIDRKPTIDENIAIVESDNYVGGYIAAEKLINEGCKNILLIRSRKDLSTIRLRYKGYADALKKGTSRSAMN